MVIDVLKYAIDSTRSWAVVPHELPNTPVCLMGQAVPCSTFQLIFLGRGRGEVVQGSVM